MDTPPKDPFNYEAMTYSWVVFISIWGGIAGYIGKLKKGHCRFSLTELIGELCISGFVGLLTFFLCESAQMNNLLSAALIGISGHMGSRAILIAETIATNRFKQWFGYDKST